MIVYANGKVLGTDSNGDTQYISAHETTDGDWHIGTMIQQEAIADPNNSSTDNLVAANTYTFTGSASSTLGVVGLQWSLKTDQNATVYIEESPDGNNWDISYTFDYISSKGGRGETVQATQAYWRIRVILVNDIDTNYFRLEGILCPIATPLPSNLSADGRLKSEATLSGKENTERHVWVSPTNTLSVNERVRLVGTNFDGTTKDTNFWTETVSAAGSVTQSGEIKLQTGTNANGIASYTSVRRARFVVGSALIFTGAFKFNDTVAEVDNIRRCGAYDDYDGFFFQLDGAVFSVGTRKTDGTTTLVNSGSFNGNLGSTFIPNPSVYYKLEIEYTPLGAFYYINGSLLHKSTGGHLTDKLTLPITFENINDNNNATNVVFDCLGAVITREGQLSTNPTYKHISTNATYVCKIGAGKLHGIAINDPSADCILTVYDNTSATGDTIAVIHLTSKVITPFFMNYQLPFNNGLTIVTSAVSDFTIIYE